MTELPNATRAPESDAQEDASVDESSPMGQHEHCVTDRPTPAGQGSTGEIIKLNDIDVYISKPADYPHTPSRLLLLLTGGTGIKFTNNQIQADMYASEGFLVLMPDMFGGETAPGGKEAYFADHSTSLLEQIKLKAVEVAKSFMIDMWLARVTEAKIMPILLKVIEAAHEQYPDPIKYGGGIYAAGYCVGGRYVLLLAKGSHDSGADKESGMVKKGPHIKAGALAHAASVTPDDFKDLQAPLSLVCVENDALFTDEVRKAGEDIMTRDNVEHEVQVYPGVPHAGFAVTGQYQESAIMDAQVTAYEQMLKWLKEH
ncbi:alpha/beta-hydrolase [Trichoderma reesei RUT C-30]|uniref:Alpha/beta-hydrolase n=1 Tax=Hypocrea jecorina (strain ATCC 56765 / BCRC 32924 / NRRL 11460 / Rut C-30) TaxID=1344414 RepID=A0A024S6U0_HYPJR|nr:alpha/beta-hydrolase [Trichoderma reesei RUT C-30]